MMIAIRIRGLVGLRWTRESALDSLMLRKKYNCIIFDKKDLPRFNTIRELVSFGEVDDATLKMILSKRAFKNKKPVENADELVKGLNSGKTLKEMGVTPYLRLHPPIGGFKKSTKLPYPQGILGHNKEIPALVKKML